MSCTTKVLLAFEFFCRAQTNPRRVALFPGAWNPPTVAHVEIARAARGWADELVWVLPRTLPHKQFEGAGFEDRRRMLAQLIEGQGDAGISAAISHGGLYAEVADEARAFFGPEPEIALVCGRDAAERIAGWDYGAPGFFDEMLRKYRLLVAARRGEYQPAGRHSDRILRLPMDASWDDVSSSELRRRIARREDWEKLAPPQLVETIRHLYAEDTTL